MISEKLGIHSLISRLQSPITSFEELRNLLAGPLSILSLLPPQYIKYSELSSSANDLVLSRHVPLLQRAILEHVLPSWGPTLREENADTLVQQYFCPDLFFSASKSAKKVAMHAYSTILALPLTEHSSQILIQLSKAYTIDTLWDLLFSKEISNVEKFQREKNEILWEDCVRNVLAVPAKVANFLGPRGSIPLELEYARYLKALSIRTEHIVFSLDAPSEVELSALGYLLTKLVNLGIFPASVPTLPSQPSFFDVTLPTIRSHLHQASSEAYSLTWQKVFSSLSNRSSIRTITTSLLAHTLPNLDSYLDSSPSARSSVKREAMIMYGLLGKCSKDSEISEAAFDVILGTGKHWNVESARVFACWAANTGSNGEVSASGVNALLEKVVEVWTISDHIKHSLLGGHQYLTALLLLLISYLVDSSKPFAPNAQPTMVHTLALHPPFIKAIGAYISHLDPSVRRCGMLVAEEVARGAGKELNFGGWDEGAGVDWCKQVRELIASRDIDAEVFEEEEKGSEGHTSSPIPTQPPKASAAHILPQPAKATLIEDITGYDSDDSLTGYQEHGSSSRSPSRSPSPALSSLDELERDPTLVFSATRSKKVLRPVYLAQLGEMVRPRGGVKSEVEMEERETIVVALNCAEELIRRKRSYGTELDENCANLAYGFVALQDNYELPDFDNKRQAALRALVACCPKNAAPALIEEFFKHQYSTDQRFAILNALALGARELAGLQTFDNQAGSSTADPKRISFPSKRLPDTQHKRYITSSDSANSVTTLIEGIRREALENGGQGEMVRERRLRAKPKIEEISPPSSIPSKHDLQSKVLKTAPTISFIEVALEYFISPLLSKFWSHLHSTLLRESRTAQQPTLHRYTGAGAGLILGALVLAHFIRTLTVLTHAARNAVGFVNVGMSVLEAAVIVGGRGLSKGEGREDLDSDEEEVDSDDEDQDELTQETRKARREARAREKTGKEASVLLASLDLALTVLDAFLAVDGGRTLALENPALLFDVREWTSGIVRGMERGEKVRGGGGSTEGRIQRSVVGVLTRVESIVERWGRSMIDYGI